MSDTTSSPSSGLWLTPDELRPFEFVPVSRWSQ
jgi:hypothetical protein